MINEEISSLLLACNYYLLWHSLHIEEMSERRREKKKRRREKREEEREMASQICIREEEK